MSEAVKLDVNMRSQIIDKVTGILYISHQSHEKRRVESGTDRINFACPYCGDSASDERKKRGNIYWNDLYFHCYNCNAHETVDTFLEHFDKNFEGEERVSVINYIKEHRYKVQLQETLDFYLFDEIDKYGLTYEQIGVAFNAYPINEHTHRAYAYLKSRLLHKKLHKFAYDPRRKDLYIFNFSPSGKIIGFQVRTLNGISPKYRTYNIQRIYEKLGIKIELPEDHIDSLNKISMIFGILEVDMARTFTVFEGPIDAMFMRNSLGITGVKKKISEFDEIPTVRYFFDNDVEGKRKMIEKAQGGQSVFMWKKLLEDYNIPGKSIKDLNDLVKYEYKYRKGSLSNLDSYFTTTTLDIVYL